MKQLETFLTDILVISIRLGIPLVLLFLAGYVISARDQNQTNTKTGGGGK